MLRRDRRSTSEHFRDPHHAVGRADDRDADDLFLFGMDWVVRQAVAAGVHHHSQFRGSLMSGVKRLQMTVGAMLKDKATNVKGFTLYVVGEGIEKKVDDFAAEVAAQVAAAKAAA